MYTVTFTVHQQRKMVRTPLFWAGDATGRLAWIEMFQFTFEQSVGYVGGGHGHISHIKRHHVPETESRT